MNRTQPDKITPPKTESILNKSLPATTPKPKVTPPGTVFNNLKKNMLKKMWKVKLYLHNVSGKELSWFNYYCIISKIWSHVIKK